MPKQSKSDQKAAALRNANCLNPRPDKVLDPLFTSSDFFDPRDLVQVKYEMVRRAQVDGQAVSHCAAAFGFSRPSFYEAQSSLERGGLEALLPKKRGPRRSHKLDADVMRFLHHELSRDPSLKAARLAAEVREKFGLKVHPRSVERALARQRKKTTP